MSGRSAILVRPADPTDFPAIVAVIESSYVPHDPEGIMPGRHPSDVAAPPFSWWGDPALSWWVAEETRRAVGFAMWRHERRNVHLHSLFVAAEAQRRGIATELVHFHWAQAAVENATALSFTLHVRREATWARAFYLRNEYEELDPRAIALDEESGLGDWGRAYEEHGWPLQGTVLMVRRVQTLKR